MANWRKYLGLQFLERLRRWFWFRQEREQPDTESVRIFDFRRNDVIAVSTAEGYIYSLKVMETGKHRVMLWGNGEYFNAPVERYVQGSMLNSSEFAGGLRVGVISLGDSVELQYPDIPNKFDILSPTRGIYVNGKKVAGEGPEKLVEFFS